MDHSFASAFVLLRLVLDPFGSLPVFVSVMRAVEPTRRTRVALRQTALAFAILLGFMVSGQQFLALMHLSERLLEVAGGVILLIIAVRMIFGCEGARIDSTGACEPRGFPLAVPLLAGPSAMATVLLLALRQPDRLATWAGALLLAMAVSAVAVEMTLAGLKHYFFTA